MVSNYDIIAPFLKYRDFWWVWLPLSPTGSVLLSLILHQCIFLISFLFSLRWVQNFLLSQCWVREIWRAFLSTQVIILPSGTILLNCNPSIVFIWCFCIYLNWNLLKGMMDMMGRLLDCFFGYLMYLSRGDDLLYTKISCYI